MNVLSETKALLEGLSIPVETGVFEGTAPEMYVVIVPLTDTFDLHADNAPSCDIQEARLSLFSKGNYTKTKTVSSAACWLRILPLQTEGTSNVKTTPGTTTTPLMWRKSMNWRIDYGYDWS